jgi:hypothetical protein
VHRSGVDLPSIRTSRLQQGASVSLVDLSVGAFKRKRTEIANRRCDSPLTR